MKPAFRIWADKRDMTAKISDRLLSLDVTDEAGFQSDTVEIEIDNRDGKVAVPRKGAELEVALGYEETGVVSMGLYTVDEIKLRGWPKKMIIVGRAANMRNSLKTLKTRSWDNVTIGDMMKVIAAEHGLDPKLSAELANTQIAHIDQTQESDLNFVTRLARQYDAVAKPAGGNFVFVPRGEAKTATGRALPLVSLSAEDITRYDAELPDRNKYASVVAFWRDQAAAEDVKVTVGTGEPAYTIRHPYPDAAQALSAAKAKMEALQRGAATLSLAGAGKPTAVAEAKLWVHGVDTGVDGRWVITKAKHSYTNSGYSMTLDAETPKKSADLVETIADTLQ
jgi:phage protein D